jgi:hypothetical protein
MDPRPSSGSLYGRGTGHWDYFFTDEGLVRIKMLSDLVYVAILVVGSGALAALFPGNTPWDFTNSLFLVSVFTFVILTVVIAGALSERSRRKLSIFTPEQLAKSFKPIPWSSVASFDLKGGNLTLTMDGTKYKMRVKKSDIEAIRQYLEAKAGVQAPFRRSSSSR